MQGEKLRSRWWELEVDPETGAPLTEGRGGRWIRGLKWGRVGGPDQQVVGSESGPRNRVREGRGGGRGGACSRGLKGRGALSRNLLKKGIEV